MVTLFLTGWFGFIVGASVAILFYHKCMSSINTEGSACGHDVSKFLQTTSGNLVCRTCVNIHALELGIEPLTLPAVYGAIANLDVPHQ